MIFWTDQQRLILLMLLVGMLHAALSRYMGETRGEKSYVDNHTTDSIGLLERMRRALRASHRVAMRHEGAANNEVVKLGNLSDKSTRGSASPQLHTVKL